MGRKGWEHDLRHGEEVGRPWLMGRTLALTDIDPSTLDGGGLETLLRSTGLGQAHNPDPPLGFGQGIEAMLDAGFNAAEVGRMVRENPAALLG